MSDVLISADSHVMESPDLWTERLPAALRDRAPSYAHLKQHNPSQAHPGGHDPRARVDEMATDGVSGEVLYPTIAMDQFGIPDAAVQEACFRVYNDWMIEYCSYRPAQLFGIACVSVYEIANAVRELERCKNAGLRGAMIWQAPPPELSFASDHYDRFWAAAEALEMPVSLHILTGGPYPPGGSLRFVERLTPRERVRVAVNTKLKEVTDSLLDIITSGVFDRYPKLKLVLVENEISWLPFVITQWDKYVARGGLFAQDAKELPGEYFKRNVYATFFNDSPVRYFLPDWGLDNFMWSNDFPHPNSTWPHSREVIARDLGHIPEAARTKLVSTNVRTLYGIAAEG
jgi:predicted TIM-barrel fold metal-dependent hydrolase